MVKTSKKISPDEMDLIGDQHLSANLETPLKSNAFEMEDEEKMAQIETRFAEIMDILGLDLEDDSLNGTPYRLAKMYVKEIFSGLNPENKPAISVFENGYGYDRMLVEKNIKLRSTCEHHFQPIVGKAHVGYISSGQVIGLSKINRLVDYYARRPQVQERLTQQIFKAFQEVLNTKDVIVVVDAFHLCVSHRGIEDDHSSTVTLQYGGAFEDPELRKEFMMHVQLETKH